jgi:hypothetical protein
MIIQNMLRWIIRKIYTVKSVTIVDSGKCISVYWRYITMYLVLLFKFLMIDNMFKWCCDNIDINSNTIQIIKNIDYVDRYVIYENKDGKNAIRNMIEYMENNKENIREITLPKNLILKCELICVVDHETKRIDLKKIFSKYTTTNIDNHTIGNIILYNPNDEFDIAYQDNAYISIMMMKNGNMKHIKYCLKNVMDKKISDLYD